MLIFALDCTSDYAKQHIMLTKHHYSSHNLHWTSLKRKKNTKQKRQIFFFKPAVYSKLSTGHEQYEGKFPLL